MATKGRKNRFLLDTFMPLRGVSGNSSTKKKKFVQMYSSKKPHKPFFIDLEIHAEFMFSGNCGIDLDNLLKSLFDSLQSNRIIGNDKQVKRVEAKITEFATIDGIRLRIKRFKQ